MKAQSPRDINPFGEDIVTEPRTIEASVESLNADALKSVLARFRTLSARTAERSDASPSVLLVQSAEPGYGKSHLLGRVFQALDDDATLVYLRPFQDPSSAWISLLDKIVQELDYPDRAGAIMRGPGELSQLDVLARRVLQRLTGELITRGQLTGVEGGSDLAKFPNAMFEMPEWRQWFSQHHDALLTGLDRLLTERGIQLSPNRSAWLKVLFAYAFSEEKLSLRQSCLDWIRYQPIDGDEGKILGLRAADLPEADPATDQRNDRCFRRIQDLLQLGSFYRPYLLCFDQTELYGRDGELARTFGAVLGRLRNEVKNHLTLVTANQFVWTSKVLVHFEQADQERIDPNPINLQGVTRKEAEELLLSRLRSWKVEPSKTRALDSWLPKLFEDKARVSPRAVLRQASMQWASGEPPPDLGEILESYRMRLLADPKRLDFHGGVLQRVAELVLGPAAGATVEAMAKTNRYLKQRWRLPKQQILFGFEESSHWKRWEALIREAERHKAANEEQTHVVLFRTEEQRALAERSRKEVRKARAIKLMNLPRENAALLYAIDELYADSLQGDQPFAAEDVLKSCRTHVVALVAEIINGGSSVFPPPTGPIDLTRALSAIVCAFPYITLTLTIQKLAEKKIIATPDDVIKACKDIMEIRVFSSPKTVVLRWNQSTSA